MGFFWNRKPPPGPPGPPIWEYTTLSQMEMIYGGVSLSEMGRVGWELVCTVEKELVFKRPLAEHLRRDDLWLQKQAEQREAWAAERSRKKPVDEDDDLHGTPGHS